VVDVVRERLPLRIRRNRATYWDGPLFATPDAFVDQDRLLEVKVVGVRGARDWEDGDTPPRVCLQVQAQLEVTGRSAAYVAALVGTELRLELVERDPEVGAAIREAAAGFATLLATRTPPDPWTHDERWAAMIETVAAREPGVEVLAGTEAQALGDELLELRAELAQLEDRERELRSQLLDELVSLGGSRLVGTGWTATVARRAGGTDWAKAAGQLLTIAELLAPYGPDPDKARDVVAKALADARRPDTYPFTIRSRGDA
jgi:hypothetical protein